MYTLYKRFIPPEGIPVMYVRLQQNKKMFLHLMPEKIQTLQVTMQNIYFLFI